jgi:perosamine synthetase
MLGYQYTIANLTAALALAQVERIEELMGKKRQIFNWYYERLKNVSGIKIIKEKEGCKSNYCYPSILLEDSISANRDVILQKLKELNIHCRPGFPQMSRFPVLEQRFPNPVAKQVYERGISLASAANLVEEDVDFVCKNLIELIK